MIIQVEVDEHGIKECETPEDLKSKLAKNHQKDKDARWTKFEKFGKLQADMDRTRRVNGPFKVMKIRTEPPPPISICI